MIRKIYKKLALALMILYTCGNAVAQKARQVVLFNDNWKFNKGEVSAGEKEDFNDGGWRMLDLPHDWGIEGPFDEQWASATAYLPGGIGWYRKTFELTPGMQGKNIFLYFDG